MKRNHYVPQAYLRHFAADPERKRIWQLDIEAGDPQLRPIKKVAVKFHLYCPTDVHGKRDHRMEKKLASLEELFGHPFWKTFTHGFPDLSDGPTRKALALLAATMFMRNPLCFEMLRKIREQLVAIVARDAELPTHLQINDRICEFDPKSWVPFRDADENQIKRNWLNELDQAGWLAEIMMEMRWSLLCSEEPVFITSDNPVVVLHPGNKFQGFTNSETVVLFPLSSKRLLTMDNRLSEPANEWIEASHVGVTNSLIWQNARSCMLSHRHTNLVCAEMLKEVERIEHV